MKQKLSRALTVMLALCLMLQITALAADRPAVEDMVSYLVDNQVATGVQYALMQDGKLVASQTAGAFSLTENRAMTESSLFGIASVSKVFLSTVAMRLVDDGKLKLDEPVVTYIPEFKMADPRYTDITVRHLLNHSSGLPGSTWPQGILWDDNSTTLHDSFLDVMATQWLKADPGAFSVYCNDGFTLAELVVERVTGQSFTQLVHEIITQPLGLDNTFTPQDDFDRSDLVRGYMGGQQMPVENLNAIATGGLYSTASDLAAFGQIYTGEADVLSKAAREATMEKEYLNGQWLPDAENNVFGYGLGWDSVDLYPFNQYGIKALCKGGDSTLYHASLIVLPEYNMSAAVVTSGSSSTNNMMVAVDLLLNQLLENGDIDEILPLVEPRTYEAVELDVPVEHLAGVWINTLMSYTVQFDEQGALSLYLTAYGPDYAQSFIYIGDGRWADPDNYIEVYFLEQNGITYLAQEQLMHEPSFGQTYMAMYVAQKAPDFTPEADVLEAWRARSGSLYLAVTEPYNSVVFTQALPIMSVSVDESNPGYMNVYQLTDADTLKSVAQVPINMGRDAATIDVFTQDGVEFMTIRGYTFMSVSAVTTIWGGAASRCTIQENGHARWYMVGPELDGKTITVDCPERGGFALYGPDGMLVNQTAVSGQLTATLSAGGWIAFAGQPGDVFSITLS